MENAATIEKHLIEGTLAQGETELLAELDEFPDNDQARFGLGLLQFIRGVEGVGQALYKYGLRDHSRPIDIPFFRLPLNKNPNPQKISYENSREIVQRLLGDLTKAENTLSQIKDESIKLPVHFGQIKLDLTGKGIVSENDTLFRLYLILMDRTRVDAGMKMAPKHFVIAFDQGDVHWLQGYCHLLSSLCEIYLAHDASELFDCTAHMLFQKVDSPYPYLAKGKGLRKIREDFEVLDIVAFVHLINFEVVEPERMASALHHLEAVIAQSRLTWKSIMAETDDDHEWLPNPRQTGVIPNVRVTEQMVAAWGEVMNESERVLKGELLIPFWRGDDPQLGVNVRKVFLNPRRLDLVLWIQGTAACPYLEAGRHTKMATWRDLTGNFGGQFPGFALWFN